jgi:hypothetical protein
MNYRHLIAYLGQSRQQKPANNVVLIKDENGNTHNLHALPRYNIKGSKQLEIYGLNYWGWLIPSVGANATIKYIFHKERSLDDKRGPLKIDLRSSGRVYYDTDRKVVLVCSPSLGPEDGEKAVGKYINYKGDFKTDDDNPI